MDITVLLWKWKLFLCVLLCWQVGGRPVVGCKGVSDWLGIVLLIWLLLLWLCYQLNAGDGNI